MKAMRITFCCFAVLFAILAVICFQSSIKDTDLGYQVANIQLTVFTAACVILCCINVIAVSLVMNQENILQETKDAEERIKKTFVGLLEQEISPASGPVRPSSAVHSKADLYIEKRKSKHNGNHHIRPDGKS